MTPRIIRRHRAGGGISCAEGDSGPPRDGCEPSWARPCEASGALLLSNGGSGGGHETCTLWPPPAPFGYFPVWESTSSARRRTKPPTRHRFLVDGKGKSLSCFFCFAVGFASAEATRGLSARPLDPFGGPPLEADGTIRNESVVESKGEPFLPLKSGFPLPGKPDSDRWPAFVNNRRGVGNKALLFCRGGITALPRRAESDARPASGARRG